MHARRSCAACSGWLQGGVAVERVDRRQAGVAGRGRVAALVLEVVEERADQRRVEVGEVQLAWAACRSARAAKRKQQPERVAVGGDRARAGVALGDQPLGEVGLERRERAALMTVLRTARAAGRQRAPSGLGTPDRYQ